MAKVSPFITFNALWGHNFGEWYVRPGNSHDDADYEKFVPAKHLSLTT